MRVPAAIVLSFLLLVSPVATAAGASTTQAYDEPATASGDAPALSTAALSDSAEPVSWTTHDGQSTTSRVAETSPDVGGALGMSDRSLRTELADQRYENRYEAATSADERQAVLDDAMADTQQRFDRLVEREREAIARHAAGELSTDRFLDELAAITGEAAAIDRTLRTIDELSARHADVDVSTRDMRYATSRFDTPIRNEIVAATTASDPGGATIHVETNETTAVLSTIDGDQYVREGIRTDQYDPDGADRFDSREEVLEVASEHYPWLYSLPPYEREPSSRTYGTTTRETVSNHPAGSSRIFLDSSTRGVFLEYHTLALDALPRTATVRSTDGNVSIAADRVMRAGPVRVNVTDAAGETVDASVTADGDYAVRTGDDGTAWLPAPSGAVTVTATVGEGAAAENASVTVREPSS